VNPEKPWYFTLFERDWYDALAPGGARSPVALEQFALNTDREAEFVANALGVPPPARLLDLCCGWGRHAIRLAQRGYAVSGLDLSTYHIELARAASREAQVGVEWIEGDMRRIPFRDATFGAVINMFTAFGYFDDEGNQQVLEQVARVLAPGGRFLIDVINRDYLMGVFRESDWREESDGRVILERRRWDAQTGRIHAEWILIDPDGRRRVHVHDERVYTLQELELRMAAAGLRVSDTFGDYNGGPLERNSRRLVVVADKV
jgi:ubiquinone/menaquinone biosynthesis C-methylase UbiE